VGWHAEVSAAPAPAAQVAYIRRVVGLPWQSGAQGPDAYDCWGLARDCQRVLFGRELPLAAVDAHSAHAVVTALLGHAERARWAAVDVPAAGDLVEMRRRDLPHHIGVWLDPDGGGVLHAARSYGVAFERPLQLACAGFGAPRFYRFAPSSPGASP